MLISAGLIVESSVNVEHQINAEHQIYEHLKSLLLCNQGGQWIPARKIKLDRHGRVLGIDAMPLGDNVVHRPRKRPKRDRLVEVAKACWPPNGEAPEGLRPKDILKVMYAKARQRGIRLDRMKDNFDLARHRPA